MHKATGFMERVGTWLEDTWWRQGDPPRILTWFTPAYAACRDFNQEMRVRKAVAPPMPLISVGNITAGGSGKTPFVLWLATELQGKGFKPVILCRGDGGTLKKPRVLQPDDNVAVTGDEARLLLDSCSCPVIAGRDRVQGAMLARGLGNLLILDDGFQYRQLKRECDIVLIPAEGIGNGEQLPAGPLREPVSSLRRAHIIVRTGDQRAAPLHMGTEWGWHARTAKLHQIKGPKRPPPDHVLAVSAIARPWRFTDSLQKSGVQIADRLCFPDHHLFTSGEIIPWLKCGLPVVVTAKDAVKLTSLWPEDQPLWVLEQQFEGDKGLLDAILTPILSH